MVTITTDSQYVKNGITSWIHGWKRKGWKNAAGDPVKNRDLWEALDVLNEQFEPEWKWVRGHAGHPKNERCDELARAAIAGHAAKSAAPIVPAPEAEYTFTISRPWMMS